MPVPVVVSSIPSSLQDAMLLVPPTATPLLWSLEGYGDSKITAEVLGGCGSWRASLQRPPHATFQRGSWKLPPLLGPRGRWLLPAATCSLLCFNPLSLAWLGQSKECELNLLAWLL